MHQSSLSWKKYLLVLFITSTIFGGAFWLSSQIYGKQIEEMKAVTDKISVNIASSEIQYNLLLETSCENADAIGSAKDIDELASQLSYMEERKGVDYPDVINLKKQYTILEIKDFLITKRIMEKCKMDPLYILYFYSNKEDCSDCKKEGLILTELRKEYPELHIYAFDYHLDLPVMKSLHSIYKLNNNLPALIIKNKAVYGLKTREDIEKLIPELKRIAAARKKMESENKIPDLKGLINQVKSTQ